MNFKIEPGKDYITRNDRLTRCISTNGAAAFFEKTTSVFLATGRVRSGNVEDVHDIMSEWKEAPSIVDKALNAPTEATVYREGDVVYVRGIIEANPHDFGKPSRVNLGLGGSLSPHVNGVRIIHHEPAPRPIKVGDHVTTKEAHGMVYHVLAVVDDKAWLRQNGTFDKIVAVVGLKHANE